MPLGHPFDRIYCVSLARCEERREHAARELGRVGYCHFQFFDATDRDSPLVAEYRQRGLVAGFPPCFRCGRRECDCPNNVLIDAQVATFITYLRLWEQILRDDAGVALVVEDDVKFNDYAPALIERALTPANLAACGMTRGREALLRLGWAKNAEHAWANEFRFEPGLLRMSNPAFMVTHALARRLVRSFRIIDTTADIHLHQRVGLTVTNHTLVPPLAHELSWSTGAFDSLIHPKPVRAEYLRREAPGDAVAIAAAERRCQNHVMKMLSRDILCVGHPRCGSGYMAKLLTAYGLEVGHERMGARGISSWMFAVDDERVPFALDRYAESRRLTHFNAVIHHVRNPLDAIPSIIVENQWSPVSYQFRRQHIRRRLGVDLDTIADPVERAVVAYLSWNRLIDGMRPDLVVQVEDCEEAVREFLAVRGWKPVTPAAGSLPRKDYNTKKPYKGKVIEKPLLRAQDWSRLSDETRQQLAEFCQRHGYPEPVQLTCCA